MTAVLVRPRTSSETAGNAGPGHLWCIRIQLTSARGVAAMFTDPASAPDAAARQVHFGHDM